MPGGRPTKYTPELLERAHEYLEIYDTLGQVFPTHEGIFLYCGISASNGYAWAKHDDKQGFSDILQECLIKQRLALLNSGLDGTFNANITKLVLGKHGYHDHTKVDNTVHLTDMSQDELDRKLSALEQLALTSDAK